MSSKAFTYKCESCGKGFATGGWKTRHIKQCKSKTLLTECQNITEVDQILFQLLQIRNQLGDRPGQNSALHKDHILFSPISSFVNGNLIKIALSDRKKLFDDTMQYLRKYPGLEEVDLRDADYVLCDVLRDMMVDDERVKTTVLEFIALKGDQALSQMNLHRMHWFSLPEWIDKFEDESAPQN